MLKLCRTKIELIVAIATHQLNFKSGVFRPDLYRFIIKNGSSANKNLISDQLFKMIKNQMITINYSYEYQLTELGWNILFDSVDWRFKLTQSSI
jgi:hypothetical protein